MRLRLPTPPRFRFATTVRSHGWSELAPFRATDDGERLETVVDLGDRAAIPLTLREASGRVVVDSPARVDAVRRERVRRAARRVLNLELDLRPFYDVVRDEPRLRGLEALGAGRLLRGASAFEDLVKLVLTTNCSWALTRRMVAALVEGLGAEAAEGRRAFPGPAALAAVGADRLRREFGLGYRAPYVAELAERAADGRLDPEAWERADAPLDELRASLLELPGVGPYVAENVLKLLGRPDGLGLDSWLRASYATVYHGGRRVSDRTIARRYRRAGSWAGLALWCDMTADRMPPAR